MPTYVYKFIDSGETIEVQQAFSDESLTEYVHPASGATMPVKKVFQPVGVTFKGSGFFRTDNRGSKAASSADGAASGDKPASSTSDSTASSSASESTSSSKETKDTKNATGTKAAASVSAASKPD